MNCRKCGKPATHQWVCSQHTSKHNATYDLCESCTSGIQAFIARKPELAKTVEVLQETAEAPE